MAIRKRLKKESVSRSIHSTGFSNIVAILALLLALASFVITCNEYRARNKEILALDSTYGLQVGDARFYRGFPDLILPTFWGCILTNNGEKTITITRYSIFWFKDNKAPLRYTNLDLGLYDEQLNRTELPINISPGESKKNHIKVGVTLGEKASKLIESNLDSTKTYQFDDIRLLLAKNGIDIFDNRIEAKIQSNKIVTTKWENQNPNRDSYAIIFVSGRRNKFDKILQWYPDTKDLVK